MRLENIAFSNLWRRKGKTLFLLIGMIIAVSTVVGLQAIVAAMKASLADTFDEIGANIMITPGEGSSLSYYGFSVPTDEGGKAGLTVDDIISVNTIPNRENIAYVAPKILGASTYQGQRVTLVGVDFPFELIMKTWWRYQGNKPSATNDILLGNRVAGKFNLEQGDTMIFHGQALRVAAVLEPQGTEEDDLIFLHLLTAQQLLDREGELDFIEVAAYCTTCPIEQIVEQISTKLPHATVRQLAEAVRARQQVVDRFARFSTAVGLIIVVIATMIILLTMMGWVNERTREIGIFRAIGYRKKHVFEIIMTETLIVGLAGGILGYLFGTALAVNLGPAVAHMDLEIPWNLMSLGLSIMGATGLGILAGIYPASRAASLDPGDCLRFV